MIVLSHCLPDNGLHPRPAYPGHCTFDLSIIFKLGEIHDLLPLMQLQKLMGNNDFTIIITLQKSEHQLLRLLWAVVEKPS